MCICADRVSVVRILIVEVRLSSVQHAKHFPGDVSSPAIVGGRVLITRVNIYFLQSSCYFPFIVVFFSSYSGGMRLLQTRTTRTGLPAPLDT